MKIDIQARDFSLTDSMLSYVKDRINYLFGSRFNQIQKITVRLNDVNGPRGGMDKRCQVKVTLPRLNQIVIDDVQADLYVAIFRAMDRASRTVNRRITRLQQKKRKLYVPNKSKNAMMINDRYVYI